MAVKNGLRSISFPSISTGAFGYPIRLAAPVALKAIFDFLRKEQHDLEEVPSLNSSIRGMSFRFSSWWKTLLEASGWFLLGAGCCE